MEIIVFVFACYMISEAFQFAFPEYRDERPWFFITVGLGLGLVAIHWLVSYFV